MLRVARVKTESTKFGFSCALLSWESGVDGDGDKQLGDMVGIGMSFVEIGWGWVGMGTKSDTDAKHYYTCTSVLQSAA